MKKSAFTLIELSIVLVIIGLLIGGSFKILKVMRERAQISRAQDDVQVAKQAVLGNTILNYNILPPVAYFDQNLSPIKSNQHQLLYAYANNLNKKNICSVQSTSLKIQKKHFNTVKQTINNIAFVIVSEGANHNMQTAKSGHTVKIYDYETKVDDNKTPINIAENYDDVADWVTLAQLQEEAQCSQKPFRIINTSLPTANEGQNYGATLYVENNVSSVSISCTPSDDKDIKFSDTNNSFYGTPNSSGTSERTCTATENDTERTNTKHYVITINAKPSSSEGLPNIRSFSGSR